MVWSSDGLAFIPEPKNRHDKDAIRIEIRGLFVGYVPAELTPKFKQYMNENWEWTLYGGAYKTYNPYLDEVTRNFSEYKIQIGRGQ